MTRRFLFLCPAIVLTAGSAALTSSEPSVDLATRARGAERVVVASVGLVQPRYQTNEFGDRLIVSRVELRVREALKGPAPTAAENLAVDVEGGTVGDVTLVVSDLPRVQTGEQAVFFLRRDARGGYVPFMRGSGILKLDREERVIGKSITLDDVRRAVRGSGAESIR